MSPNELMDSLNAAPFTPFRLRLSNGVVYDIDAPHRVLVGNRFVHIGIPANPGDLISDRVVKIDPIHITELIPLQTPPPQSNGNGQAGTAPVA
jgi:hypothetical protein